VIIGHDPAMAEDHTERGADGRDWSGGVQRDLSKAHRAHQPDTYRAQGARLEGE